MLKKSLLFLTIMASLLSISQPAYAPWIWTPDGGWANEKDLVQETPRAQWEHAQALEEKNELNNAVRAYQGLVKAYPTSPLAPQAQEKIAACYRKEGFYYKAFKGYQKLIENYPKEIDFDAVLQAQYEIGAMFLSGKRTKLWRFSILPAYDKGIEIMQTIVDNAPFAKIAPQAQFKIGLGNKKTGKYTEAIAAFEKVVENYPESPLYEESLYQIGICNYKESRGASYDKQAAKQATKAFHKFEKEFPQSAHRDKVQQALGQLEGRQAAGTLDIARYYDKHKHYKAAIMYYQETIDKFPGSEEAAYAQKRLEKLKKKEADNK